MKLFLAVATTGVVLVGAGTGDKCTFPTRGDSSWPSCVWNDFETPWNPTFTAKRCCLLDAANNLNCDYANNAISEAQCAAIIASNANCTDTVTNGFFTPGFVSTNWDCDDYAPDCLETLSCDADNGYEGTPWIMCNADGEEFDMFGCVRAASVLDNDADVYLPAKFMNLDLSGANKKTSLATAMDSCDETNCAAVVAANGACNELGTCRDVGEYWIYQDAESTDMFPDTSTDVYVNAFDWIGPPMESEVPTVTDQTDADGIRFADLQFYTPMFDCMGTSKGTARYRTETIEKIDQSQSATGLVIRNFDFTQSIRNYIVNDLGVDADLLTEDPGTAKTTRDGTADPFGSSEYFGHTEAADGNLATVEPSLANRYVGGPLICNKNNGQGCTVEGCAWMCQVTERCDAFAIWDFCDESDSDSLRPSCAVVDDLIAASGKSGTFDRSLRAVCTFHYADQAGDFIWRADGQKGRAAMNYARSGTGWDADCVDYSDSRCSECLDCSQNADDSGALVHYLNQGSCESGAPACNSARMELDITAEWAYFKDDANSACTLCPKHCIDCDDANHCDTCSDVALFATTADDTGCYEIGCTVDMTLAPGNSTGDANGPSNNACTNGDNVEPLEYCDIKCDDGYYQDTGTSLTAQCDGAGGNIVFPASTCAACSEEGCATCPGDVCSTCVDGYRLNGNSCEVVTCPLAAEVEPACTVCDAPEYGTISWDSATSTWSVSNCKSCSSLLPNCATCNGTNAATALCTGCNDNFVLDESDACIAEEYCDEGLEGIVVYDTGASGFDKTNCSVLDTCPRTSEVAPDCSDCPVGYAGSVDWVRTSDTDGYWSTANCELVACPSDAETSPACTACPWGFSGTAYWDDSTNEWAGCVSNEFGLAPVAGSLLRASARSTTPVLEARGVLASFSADGAVVEEVQSAPFQLDRQSSGYFYKDNGAYNTAEDHWNCDAGYGGADCSLRMCPHSLTAFSSSDEAAVGSSAGLFWTTGIGQKSSATFHGRHVYRECAGRGVCDYTLGECNCFDGFTGRGCRRRECPNSCSGHGICVNDDLNMYHNTHATGAEATLPSGRYAPTAASSDSNLWSSEIQQSCVCDGGWTGHDCSLRMCPVGDDPETDCQDELAYDVQEVTCWGLDKSVDHYFSVQYTNPLGNTYTSAPVIVAQFSEGDAPTAVSLQTALEALPNFAVPSVEVDVTSRSLGGSLFESTMAVTFVDPVNSGEQPLLDVAYSTRCESGALPYFVNTDISFNCTVARAAPVDALREQAECSNRGLCNTRTGECACYDGYHGIACNTVSSTI